MHIRQLADDETVVLVSDLHIGGSGGDEIFASAPELTEFLVELQRTPGPVQLVIVGDFSTWSGWATPALPEKASRTRCPAPTTETCGRRFGSSDRSMATVWST